MIFVKNGIDNYLTKWYNNNAVTKTRHFTLPGQARDYAAVTRR